MVEKEFKTSGDVTETPETQINSPIEAVEFKEAEWVFQFDEDEPIVFAWTDGESEEPAEVKIILKPNSNSSVFFASSDLKKKLRIFCREMSDNTRQNLKNT
jgi:hypothetical protein